MKALIVTLLPSFIHSTFICQLLRFYLTWLPHPTDVATALATAWALGGNNLNFSNPLGIQTSSCSNANSSAICPHNCVALDAVFTNISLWPVSGAAVKTARRGEARTVQAHQRRNQVDNFCLLLCLYCQLFPSSCQSVSLFCRCFLVNKFPRN